MPKIRRVRNARGEHYAQLTVDVMESAAYISLPHYARSVLLVLASRYRGNNNGDLSLTKRDAGNSGIGSWELSSGLELLQIVGLIEKTRQGQVLNGDGVCSLFRLTWRDLNPSDKYDHQIVMSRPPSHEWARWKRPDDWRDVTSRSKRKAQGKRNPTPPDVAETIARLRGDEKSPVRMGVPSQSARVDGVTTVAVHTGGL